MSPALPRREKPCASGFSRQECKNGKGELNANPRRAAALDDCKIQPLLVHNHILRVRYIGRYTLQNLTRHRVSSIHRTRRLLVCSSYLTDKGYEIWCPCAKYLTEYVVHRYFFLETIPLCSCFLPPKANDGLYQPYF